MREIRLYAVLPERPKPVAAIGIDEIRRCRPVWEQDPATGAYQLVVNR